MATSDKLERGIMIVMAICTVLLTAMGASRYLGLTGTPGVRRATPVQVDDWNRVLNGGHRLGDPAAKVTVVEFGDFECPGCQAFASRTKPALLKEFGSMVSIVYRHFPMSYHRLAVPYAIASECAAEQGRFWAFYDVVNSKPDSMGIKPLESFAKDAAIADLPRFSSCLAGATAQSSLTRDAEEVARLGLTGTPAILVNGLLIGGADSAYVIAEVRRALR